jgi:hypothetical protein
MAVSFIGGGNRSTRMIASSLAKGYDSGPPSLHLADLEYILRIRALIFHWLRLPVHVPIRRRFTRSTCYPRNVNKNGTGVL